MRSIFFLTLMATCLLVTPARADDPADSELNALRDQVKQLERLARELVEKLARVEKRLTDLEAESGHAAPGAQPAPRVKIVPWILERGGGGYLRFPLEVERAMMIDARRVREMKTPSDRGPRMDPNIRRQPLPPLVEPLPRLPQP